MSGNLENYLGNKDHHNLFPPHVVSNTRQTPPLLKLLKSDDISI